MLPPSSLVTSPKGAGSWVLNCARRTRPFRGCAFREQGGPTSLPLPSQLAYIFLTPLHVCGGWKGWARRWRHSGKQCSVAVTTSARRHRAASAWFHRSTRRMSHRPTARRNHRIMPPPTLPALRSRTLPSHPLRRILLPRIFFREPSIQGRQDHQCECR